jgi:hypothetical protein
MPYLQKTFFFSFFLIKHFLKLNISVEAAAVEAGTALDYALTPAPQKTMELLAALAPQHCF